MSKSNTTSLILQYSSFKSIAFPISYQTFFIKTSLTFFADSKTDFPLKNVNRNHFNDPWFEVALRGGELIATKALFNDHFLNSKSR